MVRTIFCFSMAPTMTARPFGSAATYCPGTIRRHLMVEIWGFRGVCGGLTGRDLGLVGFGAWCVVFVVFHVLPQHDPTAPASSGRCGLQGVGFRGVGLARGVGFTIRDLCGGLALSDGTWWYTVEGVGWASQGLGISRDLV